MRCLRYGVSKNRHFTIIAHAFHSKPVLLSSVEHKIIYFELFWTAFVLTNESHFHSVNKTSLRYFVKYHLFVPQKKQSHIGLEWNKSTFIFIFGWIIHLNILILQFRSWIEFAKVTSIRLSDNTVELCCTYRLTKRNGSAGTVAWLCENKSVWGDSWSMEDPGKRQSLDSQTHNSCSRMPSPKSGSHKAGPLCRLQFGRHNWTVVSVIRTGRKVVLFGWIAHH